MKKEDLKKYIGDFNIIDKFQETNFLPALWQKIFIESVEESRVTQTIEVWSEYYKEKLSTLITVFDKFLTKVELLQQDKSYSMLYTFTIQGEQRYYIGNAPIDRINLSAEQKNFLNKFPEDFSYFYRNIHNGWYEVVSEAMGPAPLKDFMDLSKQDWGILDDIEISFSLTKVVSVFSNSAGGYLCWDFNSSIPTGLIWWSDEAPEEDVDFWGALDEWTSLGIDEEQ